MYPLAFAFVLFLIYSDPSGSGDTAGNFAGFIVELLGAVGQFLTGLFEGTNDGTGAINATTTTIANSIESVSPDGVDTFTHDHDGATTPHSHPVSTVAGG
ncbi:MAG: hypothetical protein AAF531_11310 [Actinomycetota bacterium]